MFLFCTFVLCIIQAVAREQTISELLTKATFGPTRASLREFATRFGSDATAKATDAWVMDQMNLPSSLHRVYFRQRSNPRVDGTEDIYGPCDIGSRWHAYAFTRLDEGKQLKIRRDGDTMSIFVDDVLRTQIDASVYPSLHGVPRLVLCVAEEEVGGLLEVAQDDCEGARLRGRNPIIDFRTTNAETRVVDSPHIQLEPILHAQGLVVTRMSTACAFSPSARLAFLKHDGRFYKLDPRLRLQDNSTSSFGEVANQPQLGHRYHMLLDMSKSMDMSKGEMRRDAFRRQALDSEYAHGALAKSMVWTNVVVSAPDQLRQRAAWAWAQLFTVGTSGVRNSKERVEVWAHLYDVFVKHALGNFRELLQQVAWHPLMGVYLTYLHNKAFGSPPSQSHQASTFPDENMAREVMQLFTLGTVELSVSGEPLTDAQGKPLPTYDNDDVATFARVWTGFTLAGGRLNVEGGETVNGIDPMEMRPEWHDALPKTNLKDGYLGDGYALCSEVTTHALPCVHLTVAEGAAVSSQMQLQVYTGGHVALVVPDSADPTLQRNAGHTFRVWWQHTDHFPRPHVDSCGAGCEPVGDTCICSVQALRQRLFDVTPSLDEARHKLTLGALDPADDRRYVMCTLGPCRPRDGVTVFVRREGVLDADAVFVLPSQIAGGAPSFFRNAESMVRVGEVHVLRNPPRFLPLDDDDDDDDDGKNPRSRAEAAKHEVNALLDALCEHANTAPFVARHLLTRFGISNPTPVDVSTVAEAFRSGISHGRRFSGRYGDLGAAAHAVLRLQSVAEGALREPVVKCMHLLRALQYDPGQGREIVLPKLSMLLQQEVFQAPDVFGFYSPSYSPMGPLHADGLVAPEAQIMTSAELFSFLNIADHIVRHAMTLTPASSTDAARTVTDLNALLTRGQLPTTLLNFLTTQYLSLVSDSTQHLISLDKSQRVQQRLSEGRLPGMSAAERRLAKQWLRQMMKQSKGSVTPSLSSADAFKWLVGAFIACPDFHSSGQSEGFRPSPVPLPQPLFTLPATQQGSYKAIVVVLLDGGADTFNMLVPHSDCILRDEDDQPTDLYQRYADARGNVALSKHQLLPVEMDMKDLRSPCSRFGLHPSLAHVQRLHQQGDVAFVTNIGALVEPINKFEFDAKSKAVPASLFAHDAMMQATQSVQAEELFAQGLLGRLAKLEEKQSKHTAFYSIAGRKKILDGAEDRTCVVHPNLGMPRYASEAYMNATLSEVLKVEHQATMYAHTYSLLLEQAMTARAEVGGLLDAANLRSRAFDRLDSNLASQLEQVSKLMMVDQQLQNDKAVFVTSLRGFDGHDDEDGEELSIKFSELDQALHAFQQEMQAQEAWEQVVVVTISEFGRTLSSNGRGTDHGWAGQHMVVGGAVKGKRLHGDYPTVLDTTSDMHLPRGRLIPSMPWEGLWKPVLEWFDVEEEKMEELLPNLNKFPRGSLIHRSDLFQ